MNKLIIILIFSIGSIGSAYALTTIVNFASQGNTPVTMVYDTVYDFTTDNKDLRCWSIAGLGGHTIKSIMGTHTLHTHGISHMEHPVGHVYGYDGMTSNNVNIYISPIQVSSGPNPNSTSEFVTFQSCKFTNGTKLIVGSMENSGAILIGSHHIRNHNDESQSINLNLDNMDIFVPNGWYVVYQNTGFNGAANLTGHSWIRMDSILYVQ